MNEILIFSAGVLGLLYMTYTAGKKSEKGKGQEDMINAVKKAKDAIDKPSDPEYDRLLWDELSK